MNSELKVIIFEQKKILQNLLKLLDEQYNLVLNKDVIQHIRTIKEKNIKTYAKAKSYLKDRKRRQKYEGCTVDKDGTGTGA